jgi:hypothetical protein
MEQALVTQDNAQSGMFNRKEIKIAHFASITVQVAIQQTFPIVCPVEFGDIKIRKQANARAALQDVKTATVVESASAASMALQW